MGVTRFATLSDGTVIEPASAFRKSEAALARAQRAKGTVEELGKGVRQEAGLTRAILDQGWSEFRRQLGYKQEWRGGWLMPGPAPNISRTCPECGHVAAGNRPSQAVFRCGHAGHADDVASINIARAGHARLACGDTSPPGASAQEPAEAGLALAA